MIHMYMYVQNDNGYEPTMMAHTQCKTQELSDNTKKHNRTSAAKECAQSSYINPMNIVNVINNLACV